MQRTVDIDTKLTLKGLGDDREVLISGIFRDGLDKPVCYMSYDTASWNLPQSEELEYLLHHPHKGDCVKTAKLLSRQGVHAALDDNEVQRWELMESQIWQYLLTALAGLGCGYVMIVKQHRNDRLKEREEYMGLLAAGFTMGDIPKIFPMRVLFSSCICFLLALCLSVLSFVFQK